MELHELHVDEVCARPVRERMAVPRALPAVAGDAIGAPDPAGREHESLRSEDHEAAPFAVVRERAGGPVAILEQVHERALHVHGDALVDEVILKRPDQFEARSITDMREPWIPVPAEVALQDAAIGRPIEHGAPRFELAHALGRLAGVQFRHPPVVHILASAHRVGEVHLPAVAIVDIRERRRDAALRHHRVRLAEQRLADEPDRCARRRSLYGRAQPGTAGADHQHVVVVPHVGRHY